MQGHFMSPANPQRLVSIVIPAFNCENTVEQTVSSCLAQTYPDIEVVVVDDGSTDATAAVLARFGDRIRLLSQTNGGLPAARSSGHRLARGEFIAWMDADDIAHPRRIEAQMAALQSLPEVGLVSSDFSAFRDAGEDCDLSHITAYYPAVEALGGIEAIYRHAAEGQGATTELGPVRWGMVYHALLAGNFVHPPTVLLRRDLYDQTGDFDRGLRYNCDYDFILRAARLKPFAFVDAPLLRYRLSPSQMSHASAAGLFQIETVRILEGAASRDPMLARQNGRELRGYMAAAMYSATEGLARSGRRVAAARMLLAAITRQFKLLPAARAAARIAMPNTLIAAARSLGRA
jgi:glycosyltransferase involved in cell wall biosynthesis